MSSNKRDGVFYTPLAMINEAINAAIKTWLYSRPMPALVRAIDPSCGDGRWLEALAALGITKLFGYDINLPDVSGKPGIYTETDTLLATHGTYDLIVGNPPWVQFCGRYAEHLEPRKDADYSARYSQFKGKQRSLQVCFLEWSVQHLAPGGLIAMIIPDSVVFRDSYRGIRERVSNTGRVHCISLGDFPGVDAPCSLMVVIQDSNAEGSGDPWINHNFSDAEKSAMAKLKAAPKPPAGMFRDCGCRAPDGPVPQWRGKDIGDGRSGEPSAWGLHSEPPPDITLVVRNTARWPIPALCPGPFKNNLIGVAHPNPAQGLLWLQSPFVQWYCYHCAPKARQRTFPQLTVRDLQCLPYSEKDDLLSMGMFDFGLNADEMTAINKWCQKNVR